MYSIQVRIHFLMMFLILSGCATSLPEERHSKFSFPIQKAYVEEPTGVNAKRPYEVLGWVKARSAFPTMEQEQNNPTLCRNYYNKAVKSLVQEADKVGGEAVIKVRSVVMFMDGKFKEFSAPECSDDGAEGEILVRGIAIRYQKEDLTRPRTPLTAPATAPTPAR